MTAPVDIARAYIGRGWNPVPVGFRQKKPSAGDEWQNIRIDEKNVAQYFNGAPQNIGVQLGAASNNLRDVDLDCPEARSAAPYFLPKTGAIFGRASARNSHYLYLAADFSVKLGKAALQYRGNDGKMLVELRVGEDGKAAQSIFPGSTHESGEAIKWEVAGEPAKVDGADLMRRVEIVASVALLARHWPELGGRHTARLAIGGMLARGGWTLQDADLFAQALKAATGSESDDFRPAIRSSFATFGEKRPTTGFSTVVEIFGENVGQKIRQWLRLDQASLGIDPDIWISKPQQPSYLVEGPDPSPDGENDPLAGVVFDGDAPTEAPRMLVKGLLPYDGIAFIGGQSGAGKTFVAVDLAVSLSSGEHFFAREVNERVGVMILAAEGGGTIANRVAVARNQKAHGEILPIAWISAVPDLSKPREVAALVEKLKAIGAKMKETHGVRLGVVIIDTLAAGFGLDDENSNSEAARAIRQMNAIAQALGVVVIPIHHYGKGEETGLRGASAWRAGADVVISVLADRNQSTGKVTNRRLALAKARSGEEGEISAFDLRFVELGKDEDFEPFGACVVEPTTRAGRAKGASVPKASRAARVYLAALETVLLAKGAPARPFGEDGPEVRAVDREDVRAEFYRAWRTDGDTDQKRLTAKRKAFNRGEDDLNSAGVLFAREVAGRTLVWAGGERSDD